MRVHPPDRLTRRSPAQAHTHTHATALTGYRRPHACSVVRCCRVPPCRGAAYPGSPVLQNLLQRRLGWRDSNMRLCVYRCARPCQDTHYLYLLRMA